MNVSIIIVSYNTKKLTLATIASLFKEGSGVDFEVIVIDNNSQDGSVESLKKLQKIKLIRSKINTGFAFANNQGIKISKGKYVFLLNSDTIVKKGLFEKYAPKSGEPIEVDSVVGAAFLITPEALKKVGKLDEKFFFYFEDIDYCRRVKRAGLKVYYYPGAEIIHYHGASGKKIADIANQWRRLIPSSKLYHGVFKHYLLFLIMW